MTDKRSIGILGGTFDPVHKGHMLLAKMAKEQFYLDEIWMMPSPNPPHKSEKKVTDYVHRVKMLQFALKQEVNFSISEYEIQRVGKSYTYETLLGLRQEYPKDSFSFIMGADSLFEIETWKRPDIIMREVQLLVAFREYFSKETERSYADLLQQIEYLHANYMARISIIRYNRIDISSGDIRKRVMLGEDIAEFLDADVANYIAAHGLYKDKGHS